MVSENYKTIKLDGEEYLKLAKIADEFVQKGSIDKNPKLIIIVGGIAVGKSTERKNKYNEGYVFIDAGAIYMKLTENETKKVERTEEYSLIIGEIIITMAVKDKRNIVIELIGDKYEDLDKIIQGMTKRGYKVNIDALIGDIADCYQRHLKQEKEGREDISSFHTQDATVQIFTNYFNKNGHL